VNQGFISFYSTIPTTALINRLKSFERYEYKFQIFNIYKITEYLPQIPSLVLQKYGLPNNIKYVMNISLQKYRPFECLICREDILKDKRIKISRIDLY